MGSWCSVKAVCDWTVSFSDAETINETVNILVHSMKQWKLKLHVNDMKAFVALLIGMGIHGLLHAELYWSSDALYHVQPVADVMTIKLFKKIRRSSI